MSETTSTASTSHSYDYDLIVIGGGSGGVSTAKRSATLYHQKVAIIESVRWGGTCVNVGCVPKKIMYQTSHIYETLLHDTKHYRISTGSNSIIPKFDWTSFKNKRDAYIVRLNNIYLNGLASAGVTRLEGWGSFIDHHTIQIKKHDGTIEILTAKYILIAVGGKPYLPTNGSDGVNLDNVMTSDDFFNTLDVQPKKAIVIGAGYIAVEIAGVLASLGTDTHLIIRKEKALRSFDDDISNRLNDIMTNHTSNLTIHRNCIGIRNVSNDSTTNLKTVTTLSNDIVVNNADIVLMAPGRVPNIDKLNLPTDIKMKNNELTGGCIDQDPYIYVDEYQNTSISNIFAIGDVCGEVELTPMAIAAGRRLADRLFSNNPLLKDLAKTSYDNVPTVVFSHPPIGTIGFIEKDAINKYGKDNIKIYTSTFVNLYYSMYDMEPSDKPKTFIKIICVGIEEYIIGLHMIGKDADEVLQGFGVAIKMNVTKADFDNCIAIHPTAAEEVVTAGVWGTSSLYTGASSSTLLGRPAAQPTLLHPLPTPDPSSKI